MNTRKLILLFTALFGLAATAFAETQTTEVTVAKVTGAASVTMPDGSTVALTQGMKIPQGSTIKTGADGDVYIESHAGYVTSIKKDSEVGVDEISVTTTNGKVTEEKTLLNLKSGDLVAKLDPTKHAVNNYQVRTPKGVAAARGTVFTVQFKGGTYTIAVVNGAVTLTPPGSYGQSAGSIASDANAYQASAGSWLSGAQEFASYNMAAGAKAFSDVANSNQNAANDLRELLAEAVATVAVAAQNGIGGTTTAEAAQVAQAIFAALPSVAAESAALISQSTKGQDNSAVVDAIKAVVPADQQAAFTQSVTTGTFQQTKVDTNTTTSTPQTTTPQPIDPAQVSRSG